MSSTSNVELESCAKTVPLGIASALPIFTETTKSFRFFKKLQKTFNGRSITLVLMRLL
jgi:hypothetical protein